MRGRDEFGALRAVAPKALAETRLVLHWAARVLASVGETCVPAAPDDSHSNLLWSNAEDALVGRPMPDGRRGLLDLAGAAIGLVGADGSRWTVPLTGATYAGLLGEFQRRLEVDALETPGHEIPHHPVADGAAFPELDADAAGALAGWYRVAHAALSVVAAADERASEVRCWPHHFDIATLIVFDPEADQEEARSVGVGLSPGDEGYPEPYFYVTPWPYPSADALPELPGGCWHTEGWVGAVLTGTQALAADDPAACVRDFLDAAVRAAARLLV